MRKLKCLLLFIGFMVVSQCGYATTRGEIRRQVRYDIQDTTDTVSINTRFSDTILNVRINLVQEKITAETLCLYGRCFITPVAEQAEYRLPTDCLIVDRVSFLSITSSTSSYKKLDQWTLSGLDADVPAWEYASSGLPTKYYIRRNLIGLYYKPSSTYATARALKIDYYKKADDMTSDDDVPFDSDYSLTTYHNLVVLGTVIMCKRSMGVDYSKEFAEYLAGLEIMKNNCRYNPDLSENMRIERR